jgi:ATP-dependent DNA helicase
MQAMDRCHRIGQTKPVHVLRLATAHSVEGKMLSRANSKLALEKLVITKGNFRQEIGKEAEESGKRPKASGGGVSTEELMALLKAERRYHRCGPRDDHGQAGPVGRKETQPACRTRLGGG